MIISILSSITGAIIVTIGYTIYIIGIAQGRYRPHPFTWLVLGCGSLLLAIWLWLSGSGFGMVDTAVSAIGGTIAFIFALRNATKGERLMRRNDWAYLYMLVIILTVWIIFSIIPATAPHIAKMLVLVSFVGTFLGVLSTIGKIKNDPYSEPITLYVCIATAKILMLLAVSNYNYATVFSPLAIGILNLFVIYWIIQWRKKKSIT